MIRRHFSRIAFCIIGLLILAPLMPEAHANPTDQRPHTNTAEVQAVMDKVFPALVRIFVVSTQYKQGREVRSTGSGSGTIITPDGYVVTNHHVAGNATRIWCTLSNRERVDAVLVGTDHMTDIAVIKLLPDTMRKPVKTFPYAQWGDSDKLSIGHKVFAMGSPGSLAQSVTYGIVANPQAVLPGGGLRQEGERVGMLVRWILHDAQIYHGNSGGPLVNPAGEIIGVNEIGVASLGGAIPSVTAKHIATTLIKEGKMARSWTGIIVQRLLHTDKHDAGILVSGTMPDSPAEKAGLKPRDRITHINKAPIHVRFAEQIPDYYRQVLESPVGSKLALSIIREEKPVDITLTTEARGRLLNPRKELKSWGITAMDLSRLMRLRLRANNINGVMVTSTNPGGASGLAKPALNGHDIILAVGQTPTHNVDQLIAATKTITENNTKPVSTVVRFWRNGQDMLTSIELGPEPARTVPKTVRKSWFPGKVQILTKDLAETLGLDKTRGVRITQLFPEAEDSNVKVGDILTHIDNMKIDAWETTHGQRFPTMIRRYKPGSEVTFSVIRGDETKAIAFTLPREPKPTNQLKTYRNDTLDFTARDMVSQDMVDRRIANLEHGAVITGVKRGSWGALGGLRAGDVVMAVNQTPIDSIVALEKAMTEATQTQPKAIIFFVHRGHGTIFLEIMPDWQHIKDGLIRPVSHNPKESS